MFECATDEPLLGAVGRAPADVLDTPDAELAHDGFESELERLPDAADPVPGWVPDWIPDWVDDGAPAPTFGPCAPSGWLALELDTGATDPAGLDDATLVEAIVGFDRVASWAAASQARLLDELARRRPTDTAPQTARNACVGSEFAPDEVGVALHLSRGVAADRIAVARYLLAVLPATFALWQVGRIDAAKARAVVDATLTLSADLARAVEARVLGRAPEQTLAQLRAALARAVLAVDPDGADARHREARRDRRVHVQPEPDGMGSLWALLTATDAQGAYAWLTRLARGLGSDDPRSMDTRRADILAALLTGRPVTDTDPDTGGRLTWTTPTGHRHTTAPHDYRPEPADPALAPPTAGGDDSPVTGRARGADPDIGSDPDPPPV